MTTGTLAAPVALALGLSLDTASGSSDLRPLTESRLGLKSSSTLTERIWDWRTTGGRSFTLGGLVLSPYVGLGYRTLSGEGNWTWEQSERRSYGAQAYIPLGLSHRMALGSQGLLSTQLEYKHLFEGAPAPEGPSSLGDLRAAAGTGHGLRLSSTYETRDWSVGLFYQQWRLRAGSASGLGLSSPALGAGSDAAGASSEYGVQLKYRY